MEEPYEEADRVFLHKQSHFRGSAKITLQQLRFEGENVPGGRALNYKNVDRLSTVFTSEGCLRLEPDHHIPVLIEQEKLDRALELSNVGQSDLLDFRRVPPTLSFDGLEPIFALHGRHRIEAARRFLDPFDQWWVVDLYSTELSTAAKVDLRTEYSNERGFSDGDVFRHLRHYQLADNAIQAGKWRARLSDSKHTDIQTLQSRYQAMSKAFDELLPFIGLWPSVQLGTFHRILTLNCEEVSMGVRLCVLKSR